MQRVVLPRAPKRGDEFEVIVEDIDIRAGRGLAHLDVAVGPQGLERTYDILVRKAAPGDHLRVRVEGRKKRRLEAGVIEVIEPSSMRTTPRCPHFGVREEVGKGCGGCTLQSMDYRHQLLVKERMVKGIMKKGDVDPGLVAPVVGMDEPFRYRNKMEFSFGDNKDREFALGLHPTGYKHDVLKLSICELQSEDSSKLMVAVRDWCIEKELVPFRFRSNTGWLRTLTIREGKRTGDRLVELTTAYKDELQDGRIAAEVANEFRDFIVALDIPITSFYWTRHRAVRGERTRIEHTLMHGEETFSEELHLTEDVQLSFEIHPRAFFQPNTFGAEVLYRKVIERAQLEGASLLDLYCGTGTIGIALAPFAEKVTGVEIVEGAVDNARKNAVKNGVSNIEFFCGDVGAVLKEQELTADVVVLDPPRAGLLPNAHEHIEQTQAKRLVYVSCNPKSLARDLKLLEEKGWKVESIEPVDMFPQTHHIENVALLTR